ncbi:MAG: pilus assembly protein [Acidobacteriia bacterium]|nr:pilus assembly protein [Terriglobia bacterium]
MRLRAGKGIRQGTALVEFALGFAILVPLLAGALQYSIGFVQVQQLQSAVRTGAQYGSQLSYQSATDTPTDAFRRNVENMVLYGRPVETGQPLVGGLRREHVAVAIGMESGVPRKLTVSINGFEMALPTGRRVLEGSPSSSFPYRGHFDPR